MEEYKFQLIITPETYDYGEEEIVYRIYFDEQLISERSLPLLNPNQGIIDTFFLKFEDYKTSYTLNCKNLKDKKVLLKSLIVNGISFSIQKNTKLQISKLNLSLS